MKSIRFKLWAGMMALVIVVLVLLWLFQVVFLESFYTNMRIADIRKEGVSITKNFENSDEKQIEDRLDNFAFKNNLGIEFLDLKGNSIYTAGLEGMGSQMPMMKNKERIEAFQSVLDGKEANIPFMHPRFGYKFVMIGLPIEISGQLSGVMIMSMPIAPVEDTVSILKRQMVYIILILLLVGSFISFIISKSFTKPILEIKNASEVMASGDFSVRINTKKQDELGNLAKTINFLGQQLSKIEELRKDLIANVSHELRTPLSLIRGYAETIRDITGDMPEKREKQIGIIIGETERLSKIVDDILNLSQLQSGHLEFEKNLFSLEDTINRVVGRYDVLMEKSGVKIVRNGASNVLVEANELRIEQVLYNLINNSFNHSEETGTISINTIQGIEMVRIEVSDNGSGIAKEDLPFIWDKYYKGKKQHNIAHMGTGVGLAIVKNILEAHNSNFGIQSVENEGATFWFELEKAKP